VTLRAQSGWGRVLLVAPPTAMPVVIGIGTAMGWSPVGAVGMDALFGGMLAAIVLYGALIWRMTMNEHNAQQDELY